MSANLQTFTTALHVLRSVANRVPSDAWDAPSCCTEWSAREVAGHAAWVLRNITASTGAAAAPAKQPEAEVAGDDPAATLRTTIDATLAALDRPGVLHTIAPTPFGEMPIDDFIGSIWVDPLTHAWDIADATGIDHGIDEELAGKAHAALAPLSGVIRGSGMFGDALEVDGDAVARFVGFTGRRSVRA